MASKVQMQKNREARFERGLKPETKSRSRRNRKANNVREIYNGKVSPSNQ